MIRYETRKDLTMDRYYLGDNPSFSLRDWAETVGADSSATWARALYLNRHESLSYRMDQQVTTL
jgi:hypothetical protein